MRLPRLANAANNRPLYRVEANHDGDTGWAFRSGDVEFPDPRRTRHFALFLFDEQSGNEHWGTWILVNGNEYDLHTENEDEQAELAKVLKMKSYKDIFPYRYRYEGPAVRDHHGAPDVWIGGLDQPGP